MTAPATEAPLPPELVSAIEAAVALRPDAFPTRARFLEEAVSRLVDVLADDSSGFEARGVDYQSIRRLLERWMDQRSHASSDFDGAPAREEVDRPEPESVAELDLRASLERSRMLDPSEGLEGTVLAAPAPGVALDSNGPGFEVSSEPLFGLHNRDYPSLWAAADLYREAAEGPVELREYLRGLTDRGWAFADYLGQLEQVTGRTKLQALFPSNENRIQSAEEGFRAFAFGSVQSIQGKDQRRRLAGPLYQWRLARVTTDDRGGLLVGRTLEGEALLEDLAGISLEMPHSEARARTFIKHLMEFAPGDWEVLRELLDLCRNSPNRARLVKRLSSQFRERRWSPSAASSYAVGYVGRAREWGLLEQRLSSDRTYELTDLGRELAGG